MAVFRTQRRVGQPTEGIYADYVPSAEVVEASGTGNAQPATGSGNVRIYAKIQVSGTGNAEPATGSGNVRAYGKIQASGVANAEPATSFGAAKVRSIITASGIANAEPATGSGFVAPPPEGEFDYRVKLPTGQWLTLTDHEILQNKDDPGAHPPFAGAGSAGFVPDPEVTGGRFLKDDGTWDTPDVVAVYAEVIDINPGLDEIWNDVNAFDFTGHPYATGTALDIRANYGLSVSNGTQTLWRYAGPKPVLLGVGGNYTTDADDWIVEGVADHASLTNRDAADAHPMSAVTGLIADQQRQDADLAQHEADTNNPHATTHALLPDVGPNDHHNQIHLLYGPDHSDVDTADALEDGDALVWDGSAFKPRNVGTDLTLLILYGSASSLSVGTGGNFIQGYAESAQVARQVGVFVDPVTGTITIPEDGVYEIAMWVIGQQGNDTKEESMFLELDVDGARGNAAVFDIATDKTDYRSFTSVITRAATAGMQLRLRLRATSGLGTFTVENTSFEVKRLI